MKIGFVFLWGLIYVKRVIEFWVLSGFVLGNLIKLLGFFEKLYELLCCLLGLGVGLMLNNFFGGFFLGLML